MIGSIIGAGVGLASSLIGGAKAAKAAKQQQKLIDAQKADNEAWYNRNYYQDYMDSSVARSALKRVEDTLKRRNQQAQGMAAVTGGTQESVLAQQENDQKLLSDTVENLASRADAQKQQVDMINQQNKNNTMNQQMQQEQLTEQGNSGLLGNGLGLIGQALSMMPDSAFKKKTPNATAGTDKGVK